MANLPHKYNHLPTTKKLITFLPLEKSSSAVLVSEIFILAIPFCTVSPSNPFAWLCASKIISSGLGSLNADRIVF